MRIIVVGSKNWNDGRRVHRALTNASANKEEPFTVVTGGIGEGAEYIARDIADDMGWQIENHRAVSRDYRARNREIIAAGGNVCLVFLAEGSEWARSEWARDCASRAKKAGIPVWRYV